MYENFYEQPNRQEIAPNPKGLFSEAVVAHHLVVNEQCKWIAHRLPLLSCEIDLLLQNREGGLVVVEVKSSPVIPHFFRKQWRRLQVACLEISERCRADVSLKLAVVSQSTLQIQWFDDI